MNRRAAAVFVRALVLAFFVYTAVRQLRSHDFEESILGGIIFGVHELGHLISLNPAEVDFTSDSTNGCPTYPAGDGCTLRASILNGYVKTWPRAVLDKWYSIDAVVNTDAHDQQLTDLYNQNSADFVDEYAATDPDEDFAETFAYWCLGAPLLTPNLKAKAAFIASRPEVAGMPVRCQVLTDTYGWSPDF